jgi:hypothetical protein
MKRPDHPGTAAATATVAVPDIIICADWSKHPTRRRAWLADVHERRLRRLPGRAWSVESVIETGARHRKGAFALVAFDAPIGVPASYLNAARPIFDVRDSATFVDWLPAALDRPGFLDPIDRPEEWSPARPFFRVPAGRGGLGSFEAAASAHGVELKRAIEKETRGNSVFAFDLPGQVAPAAQSLWQELASAALHPCVAIWPFDGLLEELAGRASVIAAEMYPRAAYGTALAVELPAMPRSLAKRNDDVRASVVAALTQAEWVRRDGVLIEDASFAVADDGAFDALITAAAVLRLTLATWPLSTFAADPVAEGAILCA